MTKKLKVLSGDLLGGPFEGTAFACAAVFGLNGHIPDRKDLIETLQAAGLQGTDEEVQKVVDLLPEDLKAALG